MKKFIIRFLLIDLALIICVLLVLAVQYYGGQPMGFLSGSEPKNLGFTDSKFNVPSNKPNWVSSTIDKTDKHFIEPFTVASYAANADNADVPAESRAGAAFATLRSIVLDSSGVTGKRNGTDYMYVEFKTPGLGFVDDVEIALDRKASVIHVKSGSRLGYRDFDLNRKRIEALRAQFTKPYAPKK